MQKFCLAVIIAAVASMSESGETDHSPECEIVEVGMDLTPVWIIAEEASLATVPVKLTGGHVTHATYRDRRPLLATPQSEPGPELPLFWNIHFSQQGHAAVMGIATCAEGKLQLNLHSAAGNEFIGSAVVTVTDHRFAAAFDSVPIPSVPGPYGWPSYLLTYGSVPSRSIVLVPTIHPGEPFRQEDWCPHPELDIPYASPALPRCSPPDSAV